MPFRSKAQVGKIAALEKKGKVKKGTFKEFADETQDMKSLPKKKMAKKKSK